MRYQLSPGEIFDLVHAMANPLFVGIDISSMTYDTVLWSAGVVSDGGGGEILRFTYQGPVVQTLTLNTDPVGEIPDAVSPFVGQSYHPLGSVVELEAKSPIERGSYVYLFDSWLGGVANPSETKTTVTIDGNTEITAKYSRMCQGQGTSYHLTADISGPNGVSDCYVDLNDLAQLCLEWLE